MATPFPFLRCYVALLMPLQNRWWKWDSERIDLQRPSNSHGRHHERKQTMHEDADPIQDADALQDRMLSAERPTVIPAAGAKQARSNSEGYGESLDDFIQNAGIGGQYLVPGLIPEKGLTVFAGEPRSFKTFAVLQLMLAVASGGTFFGLSPCRTGSVLYVSEEGAKPMLAERFDVLRQSMAPVHEVRILHRAGVLFTEDSWSMVPHTVASLKDPALVVFDSLAAMSVGNENSTKDMAANLRPIQNLIGSHGVSVVLIHHLNKQADAQQRAGRRLRGASALWAAIDAQLTFDRNTKNGLPLNTGKVVVEPKDGDTETIQFSWDPDTFLLAGSSRPALSPDSLYEAAKNLNGGAKVRASDLAQVLKIPKSTLAPYLAAAVTGKWLVVDGKGSRTCYLPQMPPKSDDRRSIAA